MTNKEPRASAPEVIAGLGGTLSKGARMRAVAALVVGVAVAVLVAVSTVLVIRAHSRRAALLRRERALSGDDPGPGAPR